MNSDQWPAPTEFEFDLTIYRLAAIKKAAYRFAGQFDVRLEHASDSRVRVSLLPRQATAVHCDPSTLPGEVLDQELREVVADETKSVRELLLAQAFSGLPLIDPVGETADFHDDPLGIAKTG